MINTIDFENTTSTQVLQILMDESVKSHTTDEILEALSKSLMTQSKAHYEAAFGGLTSYDVDRMNEAVRYDVLAHKVKQLLLLAGK